VISAGKPKKAAPSGGEGTAYNDGALREEV